MPRPNRGPRLEWLKDRNAFYVVWFERGKRRVRSTGTRERKEAEKALALFIGTSHQNGGPREPSEVGVAECLSFYAEHKAPKANDTDRIAYAVEALLPFWELKSLDDITQMECDKYAKWRNKAPGTIRRELATITAAQNFMKGEKRLTQIVTVPLPPKPEPKDRWLRTNEAAMLLNAARNGGRATRHYLPLFVLLGLYTGARKEQITSLKWPQVDMVNWRITYAIPGRRKTKKRRPTIPVPRKLRPFILYAWQRRSSDIGPVLHINGEPIKRIDKGFRAAAKRAGLEGVSPHTLRHTCGTWLAQKGVAMWHIAGWLGQDPETTARIYAHHSPDFMEEAMQAVDRRA